MNFFSVFFVSANGENKKKPQLCIRVKASKNLRDPGAIRTLDPQLRRLLLYPAELPDLVFYRCKIMVFLRYSQILLQLFY